ncbi:MCE family protein [Nocardia sp. 2]|uniref:MCE family protein n=1 Tax=Nocardia acididurans TaxID=2802282 RepID=A0ABS1MGD0_9NOCA|nr:MlaD family protein [Nocardia acididurans]MBL1079601.1 MCE family protein [Nocardia acididurans]
MLARLFGSRGFLSAMGAVLAAVLAGVAALVLLQPLKKQIAYCAIMPDAIGLYTGNEVSLRGIRVGTVTGIRPEGTGVRVDFRIDAAHPLRGKTTAATVSDTLVADRRLAVNTTKGDDWDPGTCITQTATPKSISATLDAVTTLAKQLNGDGDPAGQQTLAAAITAFDAATTGTGPKLHDIITQLAAALQSPDESIAHIGSLIDTLSSLSQSVADGWGDLHEMLAGLASVIELTNQVWNQVVELIDSVVVILPWLNDISTKYAGTILELLDRAVPTLELIASDVGSLQRLIGMTPAVVSAFRTVPDPQTGATMISYAAPKVALAQPAADQICAAVAVLDPGKCVAADNGMSGLDLTDLVLSLMGGR